LSFSRFGEKSRSSSYLPLYNSSWIRAIDITLS
jgi:hypothetical protein